MQQVAEGVWQVHGLVPHAVNIWLVRTAVGDVLIDGGISWTTGLTLRALRGRRLALMALTHVHPDHQGAASEVCRRFKVPLACHEADADAMEGRRPMAPRSAVVRVFHRILSGPPHPVEYRLRGGERIGEWEAIHAPGHTMGHVIYFRRADGVAVAGDIVRNASLRGGFGDLSHTPGIFNVDTALNREAVRALLALRPSLLCLGHGPPSRDIEALAALASGPAANRTSPPPLAPRGEVPCVS